LISHLGLSFFGLSIDYRKVLSDEYYYFTKFLNVSYTDFLLLPTWLRKYMLDKLIEDNTPKNKN